MEQKTRDKRNGWLFVLAAVIVALALIGFWSDGFGLYGTETVPGATVPPNNPS